MRRVVVTGMGAITPIGLSVDEFWNSVKENTVGIDNITRFDTTDYKVKLAAEVFHNNPDQNVFLVQKSHLHHDTDRHRM